MSNSLIALNLGHQEGAYLAYIDLSAVYIFHQVEVLVRCYCCNSADSPAKVDMVALLYTLPRYLVPTLQRLPASWWIGGLKAH